MIRFDYMYGDEVIASNQDLYHRFIYSEKKSELLSKAEKYVNKQTVC